MIVRHTTMLFPVFIFVAVVFLDGYREMRGEELKLELRSQRAKSGTDNSWVRVSETQTWIAAETAVIVCDVWDKHHCLNAVRRLEEFAPRMNDVLNEARRRGAAIIHAPSDCMPAYEDHPARQRAVNVTHQKNTPELAEYWCSQIPTEEAAEYPIDQSDGGCDDDPAEHQAWAAELTALGRNAGTPWKSQSSLIVIDSDRDFISDRGDEVWNILQSRGIRNVILVGVHTNMCVLGRPFGLRQMVRSGRNVVLMRDMTDCMYNPKSWPFVDHFTGNDLIVSHIERFVCPTMTSDQILGGRPFCSKSDIRTKRDVTDIPLAEFSEATYRLQWTTAALGTSWQEATHGKLPRPEGVVWFRCTVRLPNEWIAGDYSGLVLSDRLKGVTAWMNSQPFEPAPDGKSTTMQIHRKAIVADDINLLVFRAEFDGKEARLPMPPTLTNNGKEFTLDGRWQFRTGNNPEWSGIPLPAKFGIGSDVLFEPK